MILGGEASCFPTVKSSRRISLKARRPNIRSSEFALTGGWEPGAGDVHTTYSRHVHSRSEDVGESQRAFRPEAL